MVPSLKELYQNSTLKRLKDGDKEVIIYGTTQTAGWCFQYLRRNEIKVRYFCDDNPVLWGTQFLARRILSPCELPQYLDACEVMVASEDHLTVARILDFLQCDISLLAHTHYAPHTLKYAIENEDRVRRVYDFLGDSFSKRLFSELLQLRVSLEGQRYRSLCTQPKYFPADILPLSNAEIFVDGGAHNGETIVEFLIACNGVYDKIHAFEPDERCFPPIRRRPITRKQFSKIHLNNCGLGEKDEDLTLKMAATVATGTSEVSDEGTKIVKIRSLDSYLAGEKITLLKLDVEKHERFALRGAIKTIQTYRPKLAICVYHLHDDLWEIPLLVKEMVPEYRIYLRHHSWAENETVMYAVAD